MRLGLIATLLAFLTGCGAAQIRPEKFTLTQNKLVDVQVNWLKDKGKKYDIEMIIKNSTEEGIIVSLTDISCFRGNAVGQLKHTFFNTGERTINFAGGQAKMFRMVCNYGMATEGNARIVISRVFSNPNGDGSTKGKVISSKPIEWSGSFKN